jgi:hypothetical protein
MENMDGATIGVITTVAGSLGGAIAALWKQSTKRQESLEIQMTAEIADCKRHHAECEKAKEEIQAELRTVDGRLQRLEGFLEGSTKESGPS